MTKNLALIKSCIQNIFKWLHWIEEPIKNYFLTCSAALPSWRSEMKMPWPTSACLPSMIMMPRPVGPCENASSHYKTCDVAIDSLLLSDTTACTWQTFLISSKSPPRSPVSQRMGGWKRKFSRRASQSALRRSHYRTKWIESAPLWPPGQHLDPRPHLLIN